MTYHVNIVGGGLAGSEAALDLADRGIAVSLWEMRPDRRTPVHHTGGLAELVCSNSLKSTKPDSAAGLLKEELAALGSPLMEEALATAVAAGGALAVDRTLFSRAVTERVEAHPLIEVVRREATDIAALARGADAVVLASGPLTSDGLSSALMALTGRDALAFYDAAAPVVMADSIDRERVFRQSRYEDASAGGDYLNAPFSREEYERFVDELLCAERVIAKDFESCSRPASPLRRSPGPVATRRASGPSSRSASPIRARDAAPGPPSNCGPRTLAAKATTWWAFRPTSPFRSSAASPMRPGPWARRFTWRVSWAAPRGTARPSARGSMLPWL